MNKKISKLNLGTLGTITLEVPIVSFSDSESGPRILIINGMHGNELSGLSVVNSLIDLLNEKALNGTLSIITAANPLSQIMSTRENPIDWKDLNRAFPGDANGTNTEQIAYKIYKEAKKYDFVIDLHTFEAQCPLIGIDMNNGSAETKENSKNMLRAFNPDVIWQLATQSKHDAQYGGSLGISLALDNVPNIAIETPEHYRLTEEILKRSAEGLLNILVQIGLVEGTAELSELNAHKRIREHSEISGIFIPAKKLLDEVTKSEFVGEILDLNTLEKTQVLSPIEGPILTIADRALIKPGDIIFSVGVEKTTL